VQSALTIGQTSKIESCCVKAHQELAGVGRASPASSSSKNMGPMIDEIASLL
jgi:hypothetical protein